PASGKPIIVPTQDMVLGIYYMTRERLHAKGEGRAFAGPEEVALAYETGSLDLQAKIKVRMNGERVETTTGRILLSEIIPSQIPFSVINKTMDKKSIAELVDRCYRVAGNKETVILADRLKDIGFKYSTKAGISICLDNMKIPSAKTGMLDQAYNEVR
ncbi:MAG TPA: DNA-directed RNA polymerase subunit beta', partial [Deltaproteobacteria bacterium]|nr:DNA-directed RNA polymerase subunit beta' [Deltaproteobacteria bacterium]